jgi:hypothetical protein
MWWQMLLNLMQMIAAMVSFMDNKKALQLTERLFKNLNAEIILQQDPLLKGIFH